MDILQYELARHGQWSADLQKKTKSFENMKASKTAGDIEKEKVWIIYQFNTLCKISGVIWYLVQFLVKALF